MKRDHGPHGLGDQDAHAMERQSRCVTITGRGHRARSAVRGGRRLFSIKMPAARVWAFWVVPEDSCSLAV
jgi:hypothetical protein